MGLHNLPVAYAGVCHARMRQAWATAAHETGGRDIPVCHRGASRDCCGFDFSRTSRNSMKTCRREFIRVFHCPRILELVGQTSLSLFPPQGRNQHTPSRVLVPRTRATPLKRGIRLLTRACSSSLFVTGITLALSFAGRSVRPLELFSSGLD